MGMADLVAAGSSVGGGWVLGFEPHQLKGEQGQTYIPFSLTGAHGRLWTSRSGRTEEATRGESSGPRRAR